LVYSSAENTEEEGNNFGEDEWEFPALEVTQLARLGKLAACQPGSEASSFTIGRQDAVPPT